MPLNYEGSVTLLDGVPAAATAIGTLTASLTPAQADLTARLAGLATLSIAPPTLITDLIDNLLAVIAALQQLLLSGLVVLPPTVAASIDVAAELQLTLDALTAGLDFAGALNVTMGEHAHFYTYTGKIGDLPGQLGGAVSGGLPGGSGSQEQVAAVLFVANTPGAEAAFNVVFGT